MKIFALAGALALGIVALTASTQKADAASWCRDARVGGTESITICNTNSYAQCMASRQNHAETCFMNPGHSRRW